RDEISAARAAISDARRPDRIGRANVGGLELSVSEWGAEDASPILIAHGGFDFAGTLDLLAPRLADAGRRVIAWDQRGHGDSDRAALYSWSADVRDAARLLEQLTTTSLPVLGHSKGGGLMTQLAEALPHRVSAVINLDGIPNVRGFHHEIDRDDVEVVAAELAGYLDHQRRAGTARRRPDTLEGLASRRAAMNPRLPTEWLRYLVTVGADHDEEGWRWKIDAAMRFGPSGPFKPEWAIPQMRGLGQPFLGIIGTEIEEMGWGTSPDEAAEAMPPGGEFHALDGVGHFVHIEQPNVVANLVLDFLERVGC
ncbi:MAG: alpha/beta hydrolase, partial [Actinomycetota bacterium]|nr:alpha/beta hydrolase [Actinomycetota bacterium]